MARSSQHYAFDSNMEMSDSPTLDVFTELQKLREENERLQEDLDECKSELMELLREDHKMSDATIQREYEQICKAIETWVDDVLPEETKNFQDFLNKMLRKERKEGNLAFLKLYKPIRDQHGDYEVDSPSRQRIDWLRNQKYCNCVIVSLVIWRFLETKIFNEHFPVGTTKDDKKHPERYPGHTSLLSSILEVMNKEEQNQGV